MNVEEMLREALAPVEPRSPDALLGGLQTRLTDWTDAAHGELEGWELSAMRDPRNWARPALALAVAVGGGGALVAVRVVRERVPGRRRGQPTPGAKPAPTRR